ncbi:MAG: hypothetical protein KJI72_01710 [Patescibacteria group bacterium]|nr:hypothetical protein [Patescibacteria group bacterium]
MSKTNSKIKVGIIGFGEVGRAVAKFYKKPLIKDLKRNDDLNGVSVLHVCIPYSKNFAKITAKEIKELKPKLTIIHSTVAPGTTKKLIKKTRNEMIVHSPVRGVHPRLYKGIKTFVKFIGAESKKAGEAAKRHLKSLGIKTEVFYPAKTTELGKLFDTTYYGLCIAWHGEMKKICDREKIDFEKAVTAFNKSYNKGYKKLKMSHVMRPILKPPKSHIGGHCIVFNTEILKKKYKSLSFDLILKYKKK